MPTGTDMSNRILGSKVVEKDKSHRCNVEIKHRSDVNVSLKEDLINIVHNGHEDIRVYWRQNRTGGRVSTGDMKKRKDVINQCLNRVSNDQE